jgi:tRNA-(ms[2]io[6]A)-hydroxylase
MSMSTDTTTENAQDRSSDLPLLVDTPDSWGGEVLADPLELLNDHAHLEKKAASNALELLLRWPEPNPPENWVKAMTSIAKDEIEHLALVTRLLSRRGGQLGKSHTNGYAAALRGLVRTGKGEDDTIDRLMVSALIEARSCERFEILARMSTDEELARVYSGLWTSERGHFRVFLDLAERVARWQGSDSVEPRWQEMLEAEARIIQEQPSGPSMHSWHLH